MLLSKQACKIASVDKYKRDFLPFSMVGTYGEEASVESTHSGNRILYFLESSSLQLRETWKQSEARCTLTFYIPMQFSFRLQVSLRNETREIVRLSYTVWNI